MPRVINSHGPPQPGSRTGEDQANRRPHSAQSRPQRPQGASGNYWDAYPSSSQQERQPQHRVPPNGLHINTQVNRQVNQNPSLRHQRSADVIKSSQPTNPLGGPILHPPGQPNGYSNNSSPGVSPSTRTSPSGGFPPVTGPPRHSSPVQGRSVSTPHRYGPPQAVTGPPGWRPAPSGGAQGAGSAAAARSMSLTSSSVQGLNSNVSGRPVTFDRDPKNRTMTMSGRVIPQRQPGTELMGANRSSTSALNSREASISSMSSTATMTSNSTKLTSAKSATSLLGLRRGDTKSSTKSQASTDERNHAGTILTTSRKVPLVYPALLSKVGEIFFQMVPRGDRVKNELTYKNAFTGQDAVDVISYIIKTPDRNLALLLGRALDAQKFFHDVTYDHRLRDVPTEMYQFNEVVVEQAEELHRRESSTSISSSTITLTSSVSHQSPVPPVNSEGHSAVVVNVNGVFTLLAECYSPTCTRERLCYSIACPRRLEQQARLNMKLQPGLKRSESRLSLHGDDEKEQKLWIHTVSQEVADSVDEREKKRQEVICEVIYTERDFVKDLEYLRDFWIKPLRAMNIIPEFRREKVIRAIFSNAMEVHSVNIKLAEALTKRQQLMPVVRQIGDIFLEYVYKFEPFIRYGASQLYGKYEFERERSINPAFAKFVDETERKKESRKLELNGYLTKPTTRLARYPLLLEAVLKHTSDDNPDKQNIPEAISQIREFLSKVNIESGKAENRFNLMQLSQSLVFRPGEYVDLKLSEEKRQIIFKSTLKRRTGDKDNQGDIQLYLFDNALMFVKTKIVNKREQLKVHRKPIPLELLLLAESEEIPSRSFAKRSSSNLIGKSAVLGKSDTTVNGRYPITFQHLGRRGYELTLYSTTYIGRKKWVEHIESQKQHLWDISDVYTPRIVQKSYFNTSTNRINCISPFDGGRKMLFGTDNGIYISDVKYVKDGGAPITTTPVKVIAVPNVTQIDVLDNKYMTLLALSDKSLYCWPLECVETADPVGNNRRGKKVMGHINFYKAGTCLGRFLVCTVKSSSMTSTLRVLEPFDPQPRGRRQPPLRRFLASQSEGLKVFKEFYIPSEVLSISFLRRRLCVGCAKGFEIVDLNSLETQSLLDPADTSLDFAVRKEALKPSSIYRLHNDFLLNYSDFSFFVNSHGWKSRPEWMIYWEGVPQHFALAYPYLLAFDNSFIEIRHMDTGDLVRVIFGENIRFLHEGTQEILYVHEDEHGNDEVVLLDFWEKTALASSSAEDDSKTAGDHPAKERMAEIKEEEEKRGPSRGGRSELELD